MSAAHAGDLADYLSRTRWFGGKGRTFDVTDFGVLARVPALGGGVASTVYSVEVTYPEGEVETYVVPLVHYPEAQSRLDFALVGVWNDPTAGGTTYAYDAIHDPEAMASWLALFTTNTDRPASSGLDDALSVRRAGPVPEADAARGIAYTGEQSNSTILFGELAVLKLFRRLVPGANPDVTTHAALTAAGSEHVAALYGHLEITVGDGEVAHLAMLQQFLRTASDGWELALGSVRNLYAEVALDTAEEPVHAFESGGDFAGEAGRLGLALREVHDDLAAHFPPAPPLTGADVAARMRSRLAEAITAVPELRDHTDALHHLFDRVALIDQVRVQRIHSDLHLGQTLRTSVGWKLVDFEGEPARPLAERAAPDSPWRDIAGMIRSFDYAPHVVRQGLTTETPEFDEEYVSRGGEWARRNRSAMLNAYTGGELTDDEHTLLTAFVADKAVYECVYEARNRPGWLPIPLAALAGLGDR